MMKPILIAVAVTTMVFAGCGKTRTEGGTDGVTHWLSECESSGECGELECLCGMCTTACDDNAGCAELAANAQCMPPSEGSCAGPSQICQQPMPSLMPMPIEDAGARGTDGAVAIDGGLGPRDSGAVGPGEPAVCDRMDARPSGALCGGIVGYAWDGMQCREVPCRCVGTDCDKLYETAIECDNATSACEALTMCVENSDCLLQSAQCNCECGTSIPEEDVHAVSSSGEALTKHRERMCRGLRIECEECAVDRLAAARKRLVPTCGPAVRWEGGACGITDLARLACTEDVGCAVRVARCCQCGPDPSIDELFAMPAGEDPRALFCDIGAGCCEAEPNLPENVTARCGSTGFCQLLLDGNVISPGNP
jgi:hypothetical protein